MGDLEPKVVLQPKGIVILEDRLYRKNHTLTV